MLEWRGRRNHAKSLKSDITFRSKKKAFSSCTTTAYLISPLVTTNVLIKSRSTLTIEQIDPLKSNKKLKTVPFHNNVKQIMRKRRNALALVFHHKFLLWDLIVCAVQYVRSYIKSVLKTFLKKLH